MPLASSGRTLSSMSFRKLATVRASRSARLARTICQLLAATPATSSRIKAAAVGQAETVPPHELAQPIDGAGRPGRNRFIVQIPARIIASPWQSRSAGAVFLQALHHDPVQVAPDQVDERGRLPPAGVGHRGQVSDRQSAQAGREGLGGSFSRMIRRISSSPAPEVPFVSKGIWPVSSS